MLFDFFVPNQKCIKIKRVSLKTMTLWNVTELNGDCAIFDDKMINYQHIWLKF